MMLKIKSRQAVPNKHGLTAFDSWIFQLSNIVVEVSMRIGEIMPFFQKQLKVGEMREVLWIKCL